MKINIPFLIYDFMIYDFTIAFIANSKLKPLRLIITV